MVSLGVETNVIRLEPTSNSFREDGHGGELDEPEEVFGVELPAHEQAAFPLHPREEAFGTAEVSPTAHRC